MKTYLDIDCIRLIAVAGVKITPPQFAKYFISKKLHTLHKHIRTQSTGHNLCDSLPARPALTLLQHYTCKPGLTISHIALSEI